MSKNTSHRTFSGKRTIYWMDEGALEHYLTERQFSHFGVWDTTHLGEEVASSVACVARSVGLRFARFCEKDQILPSCQCELFDNKQLCGRNREVPASLFYLFNPAQTPKSSKIEWFNCWEALLAKADIHNFIIPCVLFAQQESPPELFLKSLIRSGVHCLVVPSELSLASQLANIPDRQAPCRHSLKCENGARPFCKETEFERIVTGCSPSPKRSGRKLFAPTSFATS